MISLRASEYSLIFMKKHWFGIVALTLAASFTMIQTPYISHKIQSYALSSTQEMLGSRSLAPVQEQKIRDIAQKLGIIQAIHIRRMNSNALKQFGYHNAFAYFPHFLNMIPLGNQAFLYISEGFFEDLSEQEQDFLIGHELVHIKEGHTKYSLIIYFVFIILITLAVWWLRNRYSFLRYWPATIGLWILLVWVLNFGHLAYRRHIERVADIQSLECLGTHAGLLKLIERWAREYKMPLHNDYYGIFADHPSIAERKAYCLELKQKSHKELSHEN
ncbi:MAG: hypothetical protein AMXMBFR12_03860 [Candidatus Babeliales bacterium]